MAVLLVEEADWSGEATTGIDPPLKPGKRLMELGKHDCRWPIGPWHVPAERFCAEMSLEGSMYCDRHQAVAFVRLRR